MSKVYLSQMPNMNVDITSAKAFGELVYLLPQGTLDTRNCDTVLETLQRNIRDFKEAEDYIALLGDTTIMLLVGVALADLGVQHFRVLKWNRRIREYELLNIRTEDLS